MGTPYPAQYHHLEGLLFVTTETAFAKLLQTDPDHGAEAIDNFLNVVDEDYLLFIDGDPVDLSRVRERLGRSPAVKGVVILGDYETMPPQRVRVVSETELSEPTIDAEHGDPDSWIVWSDDLYGDVNHDMVAEKPVSRLPIVPRIGGILGDERRNAALAVQPVGGVRSKEFSFADAPYFRFLKPGEQGHMPTAPPWRAVVPGAAQPAGDHDLDGGDDFAAERLYLPLHSHCQKRSSFRGEGVDAITLEILAPSWETRGVVCAGACWGALIGSPASSDKARVDAWPATDSIALSFVDHGATGFVGFTALHYVPLHGWSRGGALHCAFWRNIVERQFPPAKALHEARLRFMADSPTRSPNAFLRAVDRKTFWSATCLGLGW